MRKMLKQKARTGTSSSNRGAVAGSSGVRRPGSAVGDSSRRSSTSRPGTDILSHLQELKAKERQVLSRGTRDQQPSTPGATGTSSTAAATGLAQPQLAAEEAKSRQERLARDERQAVLYREQLKTKLQEISETAIDLGAQKIAMAQFERQLLGSSSPKDQEHMELERVNGVRSLIGLPPLAPPPAPPLGSGSGVRHSRPGTPMYAASSPSNLPSPYPYPSSAQLQTHKTGAPMLQPHQHRRTASHSERIAGPSSAGLPRAAHSHRGQPHSAAASTFAAAGGNENNNNDGDDDEVQDMDLDMEEGELSEDGELAE
ncbi:hypothetical protein GQ54DRAFT_262066 [Martensiomyces pterosporus]|nr:hypothetical protein GQ54DRAFT_262066 [Martensiomyces pterosporus]